MPIPSLRLIALTSFCGCLLTAQPVDDTQLKQVIVFGRHSVRAAIAPNTYLNAFSTQNYPDFGVGAGILTPNGETLETILGSYYRLWLTQEGLLTGDDLADSKFVYFHANAIQRTVDTAQHFWAGFLPGAPTNVEYLTPSTASDPLFDPVGAGVALLNPRTAVASVTGRLGVNPQLLAAAYMPEFALTRSVLLGYPASKAPAPPAPANVTDVTNFAISPIAVTPGTGGLPISLGGLSTAEVAVDPFLMEYSDGLEAGWGQLNASGVSENSRIANLVLDLEFRTPYLSRVQSSNVASHIFRSMVQSATGNVMAGTLATPTTKVVVLIASDVNVCGLAGLFHLDWLLPGFQPNFCSPGGAIVFELRQSQSTGDYVVRASYIAQTLDQLRNQTTLTLDTPPAIAPVFIPGCSVANATFDCPLANFAAVAAQVIDPQSVNLRN